MQTSRIRSACVNGAETVGHAVGEIDQRLGHALEYAVRSHHRRRMRRYGWEHALDAPPGTWASGDPPPRPGSSIEVVADGASILPRMADDLRRTGRFAHLAGWYFTPEFRMGPEGEPLQDLLGGLADHLPVRVLVWAGAPLPLFRPSRGRVREMCDELVGGTHIRCVTDDRERPMHCHHEKLVIVDGRVAWVGGLDLTTLAGDRDDSSAHPVRDGIGWHDVATRLEGPVVADVARHWRMRWHALTGEQLEDGPDPEPAGPHTAQLVRTVPERIYPALPRGDFRILEAYLAALRSAERLIYLENQFLWSPEIVDVLVDKLRCPPTPDFRLVVLLPSRPNDGADDTRGQLGVLLDADDGHGRLVPSTIYAHDGTRQRPVYIHAKVGIVDDRWLTIGSANLNEHSLFNDSEVNVVTDDRALARATRRRLWAEHLERPESELPEDPVETIERLWKPIAHAQSDRREQGLPLTHRLVRLPHVSRRAEGLAGPLNGLLVDG
jgi:phosphatidylserine/phosphatidylglycerophosphate/cardiolipin synthase-like enzyme